MILYLQMTTQTMQEPPPGPLQSPHATTSRRGYHVISALNTDVHCLNLSLPLMVSCRSAANREITSMTTLVCALAIACPMMAEDCHACGHKMPLQVLTFRSIAQRF